LKDRAPYHIAEGPPLQRFFEALQQGGIGVTPAQMAAAHQVLRHYAPLVPNEAALCHYLCPVFATSEAEQKRFNEIFAEHFLPTPNEGLTLGAVPNVKKPAWPKYLLVLLPLLLLGLWWWYKALRPPIVPTPTITYTISGPYDGSGATGGLQQYTTGDSLQATVETAPGDSLLNKHIQLKAVYHWGDGTPPDTTGRHVYQNSGSFATKALVEAYYKGRLLKKDTLQETLNICGFRNDAMLTSSARNDSTPLIKPVQMLLVLNNPWPPKLIEWDVRRQGDNGDTAFSFVRYGYPRGKQYLWAADREGVYTVNCRILYDSLANHPCSYSVTKLIHAHDPNKPKATATLMAAKNAQPLRPGYRVKPLWFWALGGGLLLSMLLGRWLLRRHKRLQRATGTTAVPGDAYQQWLSSLRTDKPAASLPFLQKNHLAPPEPSMAAIARLMRRRIAGEARYLHIDKTIGKAVRNNGLLLPVYQSRTQQSEYLLLIEESHINSQRTQLFDYVADMMRRYNVLVEKFYYRYEPSLCYNAQTPRGISLEKLSEQYPHHILLIVGHGKQLVYPYQPMVSPAYQACLARWQHRALLTPVPYADWGHAEKNILPTVMPIFPADTAGVQLMVQYLADSRTDWAIGLQQAAAGLYGTDGIDFGDIDELSGYCAGADWANHPSGKSDQNLLLQWIAALAVYPKLRWELTLAIGKALFDAAGMGHQLNYTNLLRLARITWMNEGIMPQELRFELLKKLESKNEVLARETILAMLAEIPTNDLRPGHGAYEEKETQRIINEFNLYAHDPEKYASYAGAKHLFECLWKDGKLMEAPVKRYLRNDSVQWPTLVNSPLTGGTDKADNVPLDEYFKPLAPAANALAKLYKYLGTAMAILSGLCTMGLLGLLILQLSGSGRWPMLTKPKSKPHNINFTVVDSTAKRLTKEVVLRVDDSVLVLNKTGRLPLGISDSERLVSVAVDGKVVFDTFMTVDRDRYEVVVKDQVAQSKSGGLLLTIFATPDCNKTVEGDKVGKALQSLDSNVWPNQRLLSSDYMPPSQNCFAELRVGPGVDEKRVTDLMLRFRQAGLRLTLRPGGVALLAGVPYAAMPIRPKAGNGSTAFNVAKTDTAYYPKEGEVIISGSTDYSQNIGQQQQQQQQTQPPVTALKPNVFIQVSDASMVAGAEQFRKELMNKGYVVNKVTVETRSYNSEVYYFDKAMENRAADIERLYQRFYPALPLKANLRKSNDPQPNDNRIVVWMRQSQPNGGPTQTVANIPSGTSTGRRIVKIAQGEIGTGETPPGSNKTKYGEWYNPQLNAEGKLPWNAIFVAWVYQQAGVPVQIEKAGNGFASYANLLQYAKGSQALTTDPQPGDIVVVDLVKSGYHGGIFVRWADEQKGIFETVEGNISIGKDRKGYVGKGTRSTQGQKVYFIRLADTAPAKAN
jgi:hypothetical protein